MSITGSPDGEPQKVGVALVDVLAGLFAHGRDPRRAAPPRRDRRGPAGRGRPALLAARGARQPGLGLHHRRGGPGADGQRSTRASPPTSCCATADGELVARGRQRPPVRRALRGARRARARRRRALRDQRRPGSSTARVLRTELEARLGSRGAAAWAEALTEARVPAGVVNDLAGAFRLARRSRPRADRRGSRARTAPTVEPDPQPDPPLGDPAGVSLSAAAASVPGARCLTRE